MRLRIFSSFGVKLNDQVDFIAKDKPAAARKFKREVIKRIKAIPQMPYANRKSIFFDREDIRDLVFKGYVIVYKINTENQTNSGRGIILRVSFRDPHEKQIDHTKDPISATNHYPVTWRGPLIQNRPVEGRH